MSNVVFEKEEIALRIRKLAEVINVNFKELTILVVLTGGIYTAIDLSKELTIPCKLEFVKISSYGNGTESGDINLEWISVDKDSQLGNILIVDDICDSGKTLSYLKSYITENFEYNSISALTLINRSKGRTTDIQPEYSAFELHSDAFLYGYGLDDKQYYRNIQEIREVEGA